MMKAAQDDSGATRCTDEAVKAEAPDAAAGQTPAAGQPQPSPVPSDDLLQGRRAIEISHNGAVYRLQATKLGKLILTK